MLQIRNIMHVAPRHKSFIQKQLQQLEHYDSLRPQGHIYEFHHHSERVAITMQKLAHQMNYNDEMAEALYWATLPHDIGKTQLPVALWDLDDKPTEQQRHERRSHTWRGVEIVKSEYGEDCDNDPFLILMINIMSDHHETMDGSGYLGKTANRLSQEVRMACICDAFDGWSIKRPHFGNRDLTPTGVIKRMETDKAGQFDTAILQSFKNIQETS